MMNAEGRDVFAPAVTWAGPELVAEAELRMVVDELALLDAAPALAELELTGVGVAAGAEVELEPRTTGAVLLFADAWLVTATLGAGVELADT